MIYAKRFLINVVVTGLKCVDDLLDSYKVRDFYLGLNGYVIMQVTRVTRKINQVNNHALISLIFRYDLTNHLVIHSKINEIMKFTKRYS